MWNGEHKNSTLVGRTKLEPQRTIDSILDYIKDYIMNIPLLIVASFSLFAVIAHIFWGTKETASISPNKSDIQLTRCWKQAMCAFQMLSIDLIVVTILLFTILLTELIPFEYELTLFLSVLYFLWGVVWVIQLAWLKSSAKTFMYLPHWIFWFIGSALLYSGADLL